MTRSAVVFVCAALTAAAVLLLPFPAVLSHFVVDDSFYYLEVARNLALGNGPTFDGLHLTNGFQPLFQFILVPVYWLCDDLDAAVYLVKGLEAFLFGGICLMLYRVGKQLKGETAGLLAAAFLLFPGPDLHPFGRDLFIAMESGLNAFFLLAALAGLLDYLDRRESWSVGRYLAYGVVLGLLFLARVDNALLIVGILTVVLSSARGREARKLSVLFGTAALVAGIYLVWNWTTFDSLLPVSGAIKLYASRQYGRVLWQAGLGEWLRAGLWFLFTPKPVALLPLGGLVWYPGLLLLEQLRARWRPQLPEIVQPRPILLMFWLTGVVKVLAYGFLLQLQVHRLGWYYVQEMAVISISVGLVGRSLLGLLREVFRAPAVAAALILAAAVSLFGVLTTAPDFDWEAASYAAIPVIDAQTPDDAVIGAKDAGVLGYFLPNPVVNLDGLVNDAEFFAVVRRGEVADYIEREQIAYLTNLLQPGSGPEDLFVTWLGTSRLVLLYQADRPAEGTAGRVYKLYMVIEGE